MHFWRKCKVENDRCRARARRDVASPAAAVLERRLSRTTQGKRKQPCGDSESEGSKTGSDGEWSGEDDPLSDHGHEDEDEDEDETVLRGRVRPHAVVQGSTGLETDDERRKSLAEKGWARVLLWCFASERMRE